MVDEREKWDSVFAAQDFTRVDPHIAAFSAELAEAIRAFLPEGEIAELGCGTAAQSLALAGTGRFRITCVDFSNVALETARRLFETHRRTAEFRSENVFEPGEPQFDLVFNSGVLEHYTFDEQVAFLRGMASRSRRFVLVLIPNPLCYWYWVWRIHTSGRGHWPYGKEVPRCNLSDIFAAAGLQLVGHRFFAQAWTELFIEQALTDRTLVEAVLAAHRLPDVGAEHKSYLVAALGALPEIDVSWMQHLGWREAELSTCEFARDELTTALADSMATNIFLQNRVSELETHKSRLESLRCTLEHERAARAVAERTLDRLNELDELRRSEQRLRESVALKDALAEEAKQRASELTRQLEEAEQRASELTRQLEEALTNERN
jgi:hypothetical protein